MTVLQNNTSFMDEKLFTVKEPMSALTHLIGAVCSIFAAVFFSIHNQQTLPFFRITFQTDFMYNICII